MKKMNKKGFTLAELLIVVAIIAVLVAIAIPVFNAQLEKSRDSVSISNIRAAYAEAQAALLTNTNITTNITEGNVVITKTSTGFTAAVSGVVIKSQKSDSWSGLASELPWANAATNPQDTGANATGTLTFTYDSNLAISSVAFAAAGG